MSKTTSNRHYIPDPLGRLGQGHWVDGKPRDPFGRLFEPEPEESFDLAQPFSLSKSIGEGGNNGRADVAKIETLLSLAGVMDLKSTDGPTGFAGQRLLDGIRIFQEQNGLNVDGRLNPGGPTIKALSQSLQSMGRNGDTVLAHLSPAEAQVLHAITDGGSINPKTGLLEFWISSDRDGLLGDNDREAASGNDYGERLKATSNARQARAAAAPSANNTNTVGEKLKEMHNAREARMAAAPDRDDLESFGGRGPDIPADKTNVEKALAIRARKVLQQQEQKKAAKNPRFNRTYRSLLEDVQNKQPLKTPEPPSKLDEQKQTRPNISQQVANIEKQREIKAQRESEKARQAKARREANYGKKAANKPSVNEAYFGNPEPAFTPAKGLRKARKWAKHGVKLGAAVPANPYMSPAIAAQLGALLGAYLGLLTGSFGNRTSTEMRDPNSGA
jgi:peptidoglycan hydrolase-like protein with peptidoglycan-binding domain